MSLAVIAVSTVLVFGLFFHLSKERHLREVAHHVSDRAQVQQQLFDRVLAVQTSAKATLRGLQSHQAPEAAVDAEFDRLFPLQADGSRRSADVLFEGYNDIQAGLTYGLGAFIANGEGMSYDEKRLLLNVFQVVRQFGPVLIPQMDNFWFFTPENRLIIFAPFRDDQLLYYRKEAPSDFDFRTQEFVTNSMPETNPRRQMTCTRLQQIMYETQGTRLTSGCQLPVDYQGAFLGAFGISLELETFLRDAIEPTYEGVTVMLAMQDGSLIAHPTLLEGVDINSEEANRISQNLALKEFLASTEQGFGLGLSGCKGFYLVTANIAGPNWKLIMAIPRGMIFQQAFYYALIAAGAACFSIIIIILMIRLVVERLVAKPLRHLASEANEIAGHGANSISAYTSRKDEIGHLSTSLIQRDHQLRDLLETLEKQVLSRTEELAKSQKNLEQVNASLRDFAFVAAHDLQTPLRQISLCAQTLREELETQEIPLSEDSDYALKHISITMLRLRDMVKSLHRLSSLQTSEIDMVPIDVGTCAAIAESHISLLIEEKNADVHCSDDMPIILGAKELFADLLSNLISNALKYAGDQKPVVHIQHSLDDDRLFHIISVEDNGPGIPADSYESVFEPFKRLHGRSEIEGSGIGLAVCRRIVQLHGGDIWIDPAFHDGARIMIKVPVLQVI